MLQAEPDDDDDEDDSDFDLEDDDDDDISDLSGKRISLVWNKVDVYKTGKIEMLSWNLSVCTGS